ncbi:Hachiman antiphage defense system protein HamA [Vibrio fluvialis]|uniref:Hachiman antiphage defense system protein HamA n=1 Tax=Vibrio fluvialis TaxID=676 RepID=UPI003D7E910B
MRKSLQELLKKTIYLKFRLPHSELDLDSIQLSTVEDDVFECSSDSALSEIIYNSIIEYSFNEFDLNDSELSSLLSVALKTKIKYQEYQTKENKIKYGFYGEVLLYLMLCQFYKSSPLISRGYFYNPLENSETKGYDSYHLIEGEENIELWFGEVKFRNTLDSGAKSAIEGLEKAFSDGYLEANILAMVNHRNNLGINGSKLELIIDHWIENPSINIIDEIKKYRMKLIYPIFLIYPSDCSDLESQIKKTVKHINDKYSKKAYSLSIDYELFFMLMPVGNVKNIKEEVIEWIDSKKLLLS